MDTNNTDSALFVLAALVGSRDSQISANPDSPFDCWDWDIFVRAAENQAARAENDTEQMALDRATELLRTEAERVDREEETPLNTKNTDSALSVLAAMVGARDSMMRASPDYPWSWNSYARAAEDQAERLGSYAERRALERAAELFWVEAERVDREV
jgi:hypothetical protein